MKVRILAAALMLLVLLVLSGCLGPDPVVESYNAEPPSAPDQPFRVEAVVSNRGPGDGQVEVEVSLTNKENSQVLVHDAKEVDLKIDETQHVLFELDLPPSAQEMDPQNIEVEVDAHYPH